MKKIYTLLLFCSVSLVTTAQQAVFPEGIASKFDINVTTSAAAGEDTLGLDGFSTSLGTTFDLGGNGYIFGSFLIDTSVTQNGQTFPLTIINSGVGRGFLVNDSYNVTGAMVWFGVKEGVNASPANLNVSLHRMAEDVVITSQSSAGPDGAGPGVQLATVALPFDDVQAVPGLVVRTIVSFDSPVLVDEDIALVVDFEALYGAEVDTVAVVNEGQGTSNGDGTYSWYRQAALGLPVAPTWIAASALGLAADLAIFAIVQESGVGIEEQGYFNGVKMTTFPNPALTADNVTIQYGLEKGASNVEVNILNLKGQVVYTVAEGAKASGLYNVNVPAGTLAAGSYIYAIQADGGRMAKQMEILK